MSNVARYLSHPQVLIDPETPVPQWSLSTAGRARAEALANAGWLQGTARIVSSGERKAIETAEILAAPLGLAVEVREAMNENDRSATGFLPAAAFEALANRFFAEPGTSVQGWERATAAQARIVREAEAVFFEKAAGDILFVGHGAVGTLLYCHYAGEPIDRRFDQPAGGGGNYWTMQLPDRKMMHGWRPMNLPPDAIFDSKTAIG